MKKLIKFGIDCAPGAPRPDTYATEIFKKVNQEYKEPITKLFGAWEWSPIPMTEEEHKWLIEYLDSLYPSYIRGAIWGKWDYAETVEE